MSENKNMKITNSFTNINNGPFIMPKDPANFIPAYPKPFSEPDDNMLYLDIVKTMTDKTDFTADDNINWGEGHTIEDDCFSLRFYHFGWSGPIGVKIQVSTAKLFSEKQDEREAFATKFNQFISKLYDSIIAGVLKEDIDVGEANTKKSVLHIVETILSAINGKIVVGEVVSHNFDSVKECKINCPDSDNTLFNLSWVDYSSYTPDVRAVLTTTPWFLFKKDIDFLKYTPSAVNDKTYLSLKDSIEFGKEMRSSVAEFKKKLYQLQFTDENNADVDVFEAEKVQKIVDRIHSKLFTAAELYISGVAAEKNSENEAENVRATIPAQNDQDAVDCGAADISLSWKEVENHKYAVVKIATDKLFSKIDADRRAVRAVFSKFRNDLSVLEANGNLIKGGAETVYERVVRSLPLRLDDILHYSFGLNTELPTDEDMSRFRYIDLKPGMKLRVEYESYNYTAPRGFEGSHLNSFRTDGVALYDITRDREGRISFDTFSDILKPYTTPQNGNTVDIHGLADLAEQRNKRKYGRIIFPVQFMKNDNVSQGQDVDRNITVALSDTIEELEALTEKYVGTNEIPTETETTTAVILHFGRRVHVTPLIAIKVQGKTEYLPVGTTIRNVVERVLNLPSVEINNENLSTVSVELKRWTQPSIWKPGYNLVPSTSIYEQTVIEFNAPGKTFETTGMDQWDMPLLRGDELNW